MELWISRDKNGYVVWESKPSWNSAFRLFNGDGDEILKSSVKKINNITMPMDSCAKFGGLSNFKQY